MGDAERFDGILLNVAQQAGSVDSILDTFFGFLQRKTDFFTGATDDKAAEDIVLKHFRKHWKVGQKRREEIADKNRLADQERKQKAEEKRKKDDEEYRKRQEEKAAKAGEMQIEEITDEEAAKIKAEKQAPAGKESGAEPKKEGKKSDDKGDGKAKEDKGDDSGDDKEPAPIGNGGKTDKYTWTQTLSSLEVFVPVKPGVKAKQITCEIGVEGLKVGVKGEPLILNGKMHSKVKSDDCLWTLVDNKIVQISMEKLDDMKWWNCVMVGDPEINTKKVCPENSKLSDLDGETRTTVEKMMYDQRQKALGKPTSDQEKQHDLLEKFKMAHPEMDFSKAKINYGGGAPGSSMNLG